MSGAWTEAQAADVIGRARELADGPIGARAAQVARRIERAARLGLPAGTQAFEISNDGELANAGESLLAFIT